MLYTAACTSTVASPSDSNTISCWKDKSGRGNILVMIQIPLITKLEFNNGMIRHGKENMSIVDSGMTG